MATSSLDAKMISQGDLIVSVTDTTLISVSEGESQPQKNITFSNFANAVANAIAEEKFNNAFSGDLNELKTDGQYYINYDAVGAVTNIPSDIVANEIKAIVKVELAVNASNHASYINQELTDVNTGFTYTRNNNSLENTWSEWKRNTLNIEEDWYGVSWVEGQTSPILTRIGNPDMHRSLPIQNMMRGCKIPSASSGLNAVRYCLPDWSGFYGGYGELDTDTDFTGDSVNIMVEIPEYWWIDDLEFDGTEYTHNLKICDHAKAGWNHHKLAYVSAYEGYNDGTVYRSVKGVVPTVSVTRTALREAVRPNGIGNSWNIYTYHEHRAICHLFMIEYATRNCQTAVNTSLTKDGYKQGGLGTGCTTGSVTIAGKTVYAFAPTGSSDSLGNGSGQVSITIDQTDESGATTDSVVRYISRYRGIENPFGHIWKHCDDIISVYSDSTGYRSWFKCEHPDNFATNKNDYYKFLTSGVPF